MSRLMVPLANTVPTASRGYSSAAWVGMRGSAMASTSVNVLMAPLELRDRFLLLVGGENIVGGVLAAVVAVGKERLEMLDTPFDVGDTLGTGDKRTGCGRVERTGGEVGKAAGPHDDGSLYDRRPAPIGVGVDIVEVIIGEACGSA